MLKISVQVVAHIISHWLVQMTAIQAVKTVTVETNEEFCNWFKWLNHSFFKIEGSFKVRQACTTSLLKTSSLTIDLETLLWGETDRARNQERKRKNLKGSRWHQSLHLSCAPRTRSKGSSTWFNSNTKYTEYQPTPQWQCKHKHTWWKIAQTLCHSDSSFFKAAPKTCVKSLFWSVYTCIVVGVIVKYSGHPPCGRWAL